MRESDYRWAELASWIMKNKLYFDKDISTAYRLGNVLVSLRRMKIV
jgi:hypothetical protein